MIELSKDNNITMLTYPRSGKHWLYWYINTNTDLKVNFTHYDVKEAEDPEEILYQKILSDPIITIVRNPVDCISSVNTMEKNGLAWYRPDQYLDHYNFVLKKASIFFSFEDLANNTGKIVEHICKEFNGNTNFVTDSVQDYSDWYSKTQSSFKLISSKADIDYKSHLDYVKQMDLSEHYRLYSLAKLKCISF
jgi:myo-inositol-hexaphosphate 3-phosphohydrolase